MKAFVVFLFLGVSVAQARACDLALEILVENQREILKSVEDSSLSDEAWLRKISEPLHCLLLAQQENQGLDKYFSGNFLQPLMGSPQSKDFPDDPRFLKVAKRLQDLALKSSDLLRDSALAEFSKGEWTFFELWGENCFEFLPLEKRIYSEVPLMAASSMMHLQKAYFLFKGKRKKQIARRIKKLYKEIPQDQVLQRRVIDQIYKELFGPAIPLRLS